MTSRTTPWILLAATVGMTTAAYVATATPPPAASHAVETILAEIDARAEDYGTGLALIVAGDTAMGRNLLTAATQRLGVVAEKCARTESCDVARVLAALSATLAAPPKARGAIGPGGSAPPSVPPAASQVQDPDAPALGRESSSGVSKSPPPRRAVSVSRGIDLRTDITLNGPVQRALNDWLTWNRPQLADTIEHYFFLRDEIAPIYEKADLPEALLFAIMAQETGGKAHTYSPAGAAGPLQFMPRTGMRYGLGRVAGFDTRLDPVAATRASAEYLDDQLKAFGNDVEKALAAYNGGEGRVGQLHRRFRSTSFWEPEFYYALPSETRRYVPAVLAAAWLFLHPDDYDLAFPSLESGATAIELTEATSLGELAICLGGKDVRNGWFRTLRNLNPRVPGDARLDAGSTVRIPSMLVPMYVARCAADASLRARARDMHDAAYASKRHLVEYTVKTGDTLASIAWRFDCASIGGLVRLNRLVGPGGEIQPGQRLNVPLCG